MTFTGFTREYLDGLVAADPETERHFTRYFHELLYLKLRSKVRSPELIEDISQETLMRVIRLARRGEIVHPERLGGFVHSVSNNVLMEHIRQETRHPQIPENAAEPADDRTDPGMPLANEDNRRIVTRILGVLPEKDRDLLRMVFLEEVDKSEIARRLGVDPDYLRVMLHRAKGRFRAAYLETMSARKAAP